MDLVTLAKCNLSTDSGGRIKVHQLWKDQTAIIVFIRHFACIACRVHARELWARKENYESKGAKIYFVGNGSPNFIAGFKDDIGINGAPVYTDPSLESFRAAGFKKGFLAAMGPRAIMNAYKMEKNNKDLPTKYEKGMGDLWQLGGVVSVAKDGRLVFHHINEVLGEYPPENDRLGIQ